MTARPSSLFETIGVFGGELRLWDRHMARLAASMRAHGDEAAIPSDLREQAMAQLAAALRHDVLVVERALSQESTSGFFALRTRSKTASPWARALRGEAVLVLPTLVRRAVGVEALGHKARPRAFYDAVLAEARVGGADDGIVIGDDGALLETAVGNLWLHLDSVWVTPPLDGRVVPGVARGLLLDRAAANQIPVGERRCFLPDLHRADAICLSNAAFGVAPAALRATTAPELHSSLRRLWRFAVGD